MWHSQPLLKCHWPCGARGWNGESISVQGVRSHERGVHWDGRGAPTKLQQLQPQEALTPSPLTPCFTWYWPPDWSTGCEEFHTSSWSFSQDKGPWWCSKTGDQSRWTACGFLEERIWGGPSEVCTVQMTEVGSRLQVRTQHPEICRIWLAAPPPLSSKTPPGPSSAHPPYEGTGMYLPGTIPTSDHHKRISSSQPSLRLMTHKSKNKEQCCWRRDQDQGINRIHCPVPWPEGAPGLMGDLYRGQHWI